MTEPTAQSGNPLIFAFFNQKGGVGKTTTTVNVAMHFQMKGMRVGIFDFDPQASVVKYSLLTSEPTCFPGRVHQFALAPHTPDSQVSKRVLQIQQYRDLYDIILIDVPAGNTALAYHILNISDLVVVPVQPNKGDIDATDEAWQMIDASLKVNPDLIRTVLFTRVPRTNTAKDSMKRDAAAREWAEYIAPFVISDRAAFPKAWSYGATVFSLNDSAAIAEIQLFGDYIIKLANDAKEEN